MLSCSQEGIDNPVLFTLSNILDEERFMERSSHLYQTYLNILQHELITAMGCTEPIAVAYCSAIAREVLGTIPGRVEAEVSSNIINNIRSVIVPNTGGLRGIEAAAAAGIIAGRVDRGLEVIPDVTDEQKKRIRDYLHTRPVLVSAADTDHSLDIKITVCSNHDKASVQIRDGHTNVIRIEKNGEVLYEKNSRSSICSHEQDCSLLTMEKIYDFAETADLDDVVEMLDRQMRCNSEIAEEGLRGNYGANIGSVLLTSYGDNVKIRAKAMAAAGSDARMSGCALPVVINSGSGNQGLTVTMPLIVFAEEYGIEQDRLYRALLISNLSAIHLSSQAGKFSACCGAVTAGASAGAGIAYLLGGGLEEINHTLLNALSITSGIICDGARASCAARIAASVDAGILGYNMYQNGQEFYDGDSVGVESAICQIGRRGIMTDTSSDQSDFPQISCVD